MIKPHWTTRYTRIPVEKLPEMVGKQVHLGWASKPGFVWNLEKIEGNRLHLITPKTRKRITSSIHDAYYTINHKPNGSNDVQM